MEKSNPPESSNPISNLWRIGFLHSWSSYDAATIRASHTSRNIKQVITIQGWRNPILQRVVIQFLLSGGLDSFTLGAQGLRKNAFANTLSRNLFKWIENLVQKCVEIILSTHTSFKNKLLIVFFHFLRQCFGYQAVDQGDLLNSSFRSQLGPSIKACFIHLMSTI